MNGVALIAFVAFLYLFRFFFLVSFNDSSKKIRLNSVSTELSRIGMREEQQAIFVHSAQHHLHCCCCCIRLLSGGSNGDSHAGCREAHAGSHHHLLKRICILLLVQVDQQHLVVKRRRKRVGVRESYRCVCVCECERMREREKMCVCVCLCANRGRKPCRGISTHRHTDTPVLATRCETPHGGQMSAAWDDRHSSACRWSERQGCRTPC